MYQGGSALPSQCGEVTPILIRYDQDATVNNTSELLRAGKKIFTGAGFKRGIIISKDRTELRGAIKVLPLTYFLMFYRDYL